MSKYDPLREMLLDVHPTISEIRLTFDGIESILGFALPASAHQYREWWANPTSVKQHSHAQSWLAGGWRVESVDQSQAWVNFKRG